MYAITRRGALRTGLCASLFACALPVLLSGCAAAPEQAAFSAGITALQSRAAEKDSNNFQGYLDRSGTGFKLYGAYDPGVKEKIVLEGGFARMGDVSFDGTWQGQTDVGTIETDIIEVSAGYRYPFTEKFSAGGRVGAAYADVEENEVFAGTPYTNSVSETVPFGGVVFHYAVGEQWSFSANYDRYLDVGEVGETGEGDLEVFGVSAEFRFGGNNRDR